MKHISESLLVGALLSGGLLFCTAPEAHARWFQAPDNTGANKADQNSSAPTADKAKNDTSDRTLMKNIRRDIVRDKSLSTEAHNVKVVASGGKVTLRGPVKSEDEKKAIEEHATKYAGAGNVTNELSVKGS